jgi:hypothetical protein
MNSGLVSSYEFIIFLSMGLNTESLGIGGLNAKFGTQDSQYAKQGL